MRKRIGQPFPLRSVGWLRAFLCLVLVLSGSLHALSAQSHQPQHHTTSEAGDHAPCKHTSDHKGQAECVTGLSCAYLMVSSELQVIPRLSRHLAHPARTSRFAESLVAPLFHPPKAFG